MKKIFLIILGLMALSSVALNAQELMRNTSVYNLTDGVGLKGYDPVSYFPEGGNEASVGNQKIKLNYLGVTYFFGREENLKLFKENPAKYEPTYGGFCAYAMASGARVDIQPNLYTINGNRIHFFVSKRAKQSFDRELTLFEGKADSFWREISGEEPRL